MNVLMNNETVRSSSPVSMAGNKLIIVTVYANSEEDAISTAIIPYNEWPNNTVCWIGDETTGCEIHISGSTLQLSGQNVSSLKAYVIGLSF